MKRDQHQWRPLRHPGRMVVSRRWRWGKHCLISPRGTVFETRVTHMGLLARRMEFQLSES